MINIQKGCARAGFTLMEILIAVMIIGLVGAMVGPYAVNAYKDAQKRTAKSSMRSLKDAISMYQMHLGHLPQSLKDLIKEPKDERDKKKWQKYIEKDEVPEDPWNNSFVYKLTPGGKHPYDLYSRGSNGSDAPKEEWISVWDE